MGNIQQRCLATDICDDISTATHRVLGLKASATLAEVSKNQFEKPPRLLRPNQGPNKDYTFTDFVIYLEEKQKLKPITEKKVSQHRGKRHLDYLPKRNKLRSVEIEIRPRLQVTGAINKHFVNETFFDDKFNGCSLNQTEHAHTQMVGNQTADFTR